MTTLYIINADAKKFDPPEEKIFSENPVEIYDKLFSSLIQEKKEVVIETVIDGYPLGYHLWWDNEEEYRAKTLTVCRRFGPTEGLAYPISAKTLFEIMGIILKGGETNVFI